VQHGGLIQMTQPDDQSISHSQTQNLGSFRTADRLEWQNGTAGGRDSLPRDCDNLDTLRQPHD
jgi:hypothetical protein